jgi:two-component system chemotaxis sensor kinase CheA
MDELQEFKITYFQECEELLQDAETHLSELKDDSGNTELLHAIFRSIHSIKGGAGAFGFDRLVGFAHVFETVLDQMREGELAPTEENIDLMIRSQDILADLVDAARNGADIPEGYEDEALASLRTLGGVVAPVVHATSDDDDDDDDDFGFVPVSVADDAPAEEDAPKAASGDMGEYTINFDPHDELIERANEPLLLLRELKSLGGLTVEADTSRLPPLDEIRPLAAYFRWHMVLNTEEPEARIRETFEFVEDDCTLSISSGVQENPFKQGNSDHVPAAVPAAQTSGNTVATAPAPAAKDKNTTATPPVPPTPTAESTQSAPVDTPVVKAAAKPLAAPPAGRPTPAGAPKAAAVASASNSPPPQRSVSSIRVDLDKVDKLVNVVGEMVITQAMLFAQAETRDHTEDQAFMRGLEALSQHTRELQDNVMAIRAQPVKTVFTRVPRLIRELSAQTGKKVHLETQGEGTEIDKTVIEQLGDPLTHLIRNAVDHGIEDPETRIAAGKDPEGLIVLSASQRGGHIVIEIIDDGRGINREKVYNKAVEKGLIKPDAVLTDEEVDNMIFHPGFSTADQVSNISGRGVGMDVVRSNIQTLGGRVSVTSFPGKGSTFVMTLPLTLAVLDGMILRVAGETFVLPLSNIIETMQMDEAAVGDVVAAGEVFQVRGEYIQLMRLRQAFDLPAKEGQNGKTLAVIVETESGEKLGVIVDEIVGQQQVVVKSLEENFRPVPGIAAATILGSGRVALILDVSGLRSLMLESCGDVVKGGAKALSADVQKLLGQVSGT